MELMEVISANSSTIFRSESFKTSFPPGFTKSNKDISSKNYKTLQIELEKLVANLRTKIDDSKEQLSQVQQLIDKAVCLDKVTALIID